MWAVTTCFGGGGGRFVFGGGSSGGGGSGGCWVTTCVGGGGGRFVFGGGSSGGGGTGGCWGGLLHIGLGHFFGHVQHIRAVFCIRRVHGIHGIHRGTSWFHDVGGNCFTVAKCDVVRDKTVGTGLLQVFVGSGDNGVALRFCQWVAGYHSVHNAPSVVGQRRFSVIGFVEKGTGIPHPRRFGNEIRGGVGEFSHEGELTGFVDIVQNNKMMVKGNQVQRG